MSDLKKIIESTLVPHQAFDEAIRRLEQCFDYAQDGTEPICIAVVGESRTGKSRALEECFVRHPRTRTPEGLNTPILRVTTPSKPSVNGLAELMLYAMGDPLFDKGTENVKTLRIRKLMKECGTTMLMIDEFQHFVDKGSDKVMHHVADWLKALVDDTRVALAVAGLPICEAVLNQNEQFDGRFFSPAFMPRFNWGNSEHRNEFEAILGAFYVSISRHFEIPELDDAEMAFRCYCATGGLIGYLTKLLRQAVWNALDNDRKTINLSDLALAHHEAVRAKGNSLDIPCPFAKNFTAAPTDDLLAKIKLIGTSTPPLPNPRKRKTRETEKQSVSNVLSAQ